MEKFSSEEINNLKIKEVRSLSDLADLCHLGHNTVMVELRGRQPFPQGSLFLVSGLTSDMEVEVDNTTEWGSIHIIKKSV